MFFLSLIAAFFTLTQAFAQAPLPFPACAPDIAKVCASGEGRIPTETREIAQCLRKNAEALSLECKQDIERYAQASRQAAARGGGALGSFGGFTSLTPPIPIAAYEGRFTPAKDELYENRLTLSSPVAGSATSVTSLSLSAGELHFAQSPTLTSSQKLPQDLYRAELGVQSSKYLAGKKSLGLRFSVGSTGDQVFQSIRDANFSLALTYGFPGTNEKDYWVALVYFANNSTLGDYIPLPGVIYIHRAPGLTAILGFPIISLQWTPSPLTAYSLSIFGTTLITEAAYGSVTASQGFLQASFNQQRYILHDRVDDRDRLTFEERKIGVGYRTPFASRAFFEAQVGRAFGRKTYIGPKIFNTSGGVADLDDGNFIQVQLKAAF